MLSLSKTILNTKTYQFLVWAPVIEYNSTKYVTLLHWAVAVATVNLVEKIINKGAPVCKHFSKSVLKY